MHGTVTLGAEVTNVSTHCFWLLLGNEELAVPFSDFPWFKKATIDELSEVQRPTEDHLYWPQLDVDLSVESIRQLPAISLEVERPALRLMLNHDDGITDGSHLSRHRVDAFDDPLGLEGFVLTRAQGLLDVNDEKGTVHGFEA